MIRGRWREGDGSEYIFVDVSSTYVAMALEDVRLQTLCCVLQFVFPDPDVSSVSKTVVIEQSKSVSRLHCQISRSWRENKALRV